jgi:uncharacterized iron-regulated membrane protein
MLLLAVTGLVILYKDAVDPVQHPGILTVDVPAHRAPQPPSALEAAVIHLGEQAAVVVPLAGFLRLRALERRASIVELEEARGHCSGRGLEVSGIGLPAKSHPG